MLRLTVLALSVLLLGVAVEGGHHKGGHDDDDHHDDDDKCLDGADGVCQRKKCAYGFGENPNGSCAKKYYKCCQEVPDACGVLGGFCIKTKSCPEHHKKTGNAKTLCGSKRSVCCVPDLAVYAKCNVQPASGNFADQVTGTIHFRQGPGKELEYTVNLEGFSTSDDNVFHGFHVHTHGDTSNACVGAAGHFNPESVDHGHKDSHARHIGDFGNIEEDNKGRVRMITSDSKAALTGEYSIMGRAIVIHEGKDDHGENDDAGSKASGNAGPRVACCVIGHVSGGHWAREREELQTAGVRNS